MALDDAAVAEIQRLYAGTKVTVAQIGDQFGVSPSAICKLARQRGWPTRSELMGRSPRRGQPSTPKARAMLAHRLCDAIIKKLDQMEKGMESGELNSSDYERDAKSVGSMISGMEKVAAVGSDGDKKRTPKTAETAFSDVERIRREIVERFERLQRSRNAAPRSR